MICPSCRQPASSMLRTSFSLQNVSIIQSFEGYLRCQHCGILLKNVRFNSVLRNSTILFITALLLVMAFSDRIFRSFGSAGLAVYWVIIVVSASSTFVYFSWKYSVLVNAEKGSSRN